jgi:hypothetical protein
MRKINQFEASLDNVIEFLSSLFEKGLGYSSINTARSALSALGLKFDSILVGQYPLIISYLRGVFNLRPCRPKYTCIWDAQLVLNLLRTSSPVKFISLKDLTLKLTMLLALTNATLIQSVHLICLNNVHIFKSEFVFKNDDLVKQRRPGYKEPVISYKAYTPDRRLCIYTVLKEYLFRTKKMRDSSISRLLLSYVKPHKNVTKDTISRWIKVILNRPGINTKIFGSHSVRSASTSYAKSNAFPIDETLKKA